jgi:LAGLIDADG-like domain
MTRSRDLVGQIFGHRMVVDYAGSIYNRKHWIVRCVCGRVDKVSGTSLRVGEADQCRNCKPVFDADGCVCATDGAVTFSQKPHGGLEVVSKVLTTFGVEHTLRRPDKTNKQVLYITVAGRPRFRDVIHPRYPKKTRLLEAMK